MARVTFNQRENYVPMVEKAAHERVVKHMKEEMEHLKHEEEQWIHIAEEEKLELNALHEHERKLKVKAFAIGGLGWLLLFISLAVDHL